jgi:hypothetical protein
VHTLLASSGLAKKWDAEGRKYIVFFQVENVSDAFASLHEATYPLQDTNALCFTVTVAAIGVSEEKNYEVPIDRL